jgi:hypothetical protein
MCGTMRLCSLREGGGRDAADVAISTAFGIAKLARFDVITQEQTQDG